jgi:hypothetical protein
MNFDIVWERTRTEQSYYDFAVELGLITETDKYCICMAKIKLVVRKDRNGVNKRWLCGRSVSVFKGTVFEYIRI